MNETEKQNYIRLETTKLQKLADIIHYANDLLQNSTDNIREALDNNIRLMSDSCMSKSDIENEMIDNLFEMVDEYKILLSINGELK